MFGGGYFLLHALGPSTDSTITPPNPYNDMQLTSPAFSHDEAIPAEFTCDGSDVSPQLDISGVPSNAKSLAIIVHDPDAPKEGGWTHWTLWNIDPDTESIDEDDVPEGAVEGLTDFDEPGYGGPCPPSGTHHYNFTLYALDTELELDEEAGKAELEAAMEGHIIAEATLTGTYSREE